jgi:hypothetical protein
MIYIPSFIKISSEILTLIREYTYRHTYTEDCDLTSLFVFFQNKKIVHVLYGFEKWSTSLGEKFSSKL